MPDQSDNIETIELWCLLQDIDAAYIFDDGMDFETGLSSLLEVPNLDFSNSFDYQPTVTGNSAPTDNTSNMNGNFPFLASYMYIPACVHSPPGFHLSPLTKLSSPISQAFIWFSQCQLR